MMTLYTTMLTKYSKGFLGYALGSSLFLLFITLLFPNIQESLKAKADIMNTMPEGMLAAFGLEKGQFISTLLDLLSVQYYSMLFLILLSIFTITTASKLLARLVEQGSMAYILAMPISRGKVAVAMILVYLSGLFFIIASNFLISLVGAMIIQYDLDVILFFQLHMLGFLLFFAIGGYSFLCSALFTEERRVLSVAGGFTFLFYVLHMIGGINKTYEVAKSFSLFSLYEPSTILKGDTNTLVAVLILLLVGMLGYVASVYVFQRKDLLL
ncbi:ABC transporter permease subunit [Ectobacillus antri]|uniref:ABC transporter permease subunit n=1 Tax=Ectobacillus antri TaxID=2486280 RepID=UPI003F6C98DE